MYPAELSVGVRLTHVFPRRTSQVFATIREIGPAGVWFRIDRVDNHPADGTIVFLERYLVDLAFDEVQRPNVCVGARVRLVMRVHERGNCLYREGTVLIAQPPEAPSGGAFRRFGTRLRRAKAKRA